MCVLSPALLRQLACPNQTKAYDSVRMCHTWALVLCANNQPSSVEFQRRESFLYRRDELLSFKDIASVGVLIMAVENTLKHAGLDLPQQVTAKATSHASHQFYLSVTPSYLWRTMSSSKAPQP